jgi:ABC-type branched-subunit amino acid transport system substrate-binding protein
VGIVSLFVAFAALRPVSLATGTRTARMLAAGALALVAAACARDGGAPIVEGGAPAPAAPTGEVIGSGSVTVGLVLPLGGGLGQAFKNSAALAMSEFPQADIRLVVKDDGGSEEGARAAAQAAVAEGAQAIIGPIFAPAVTGAASVARPANVPVIAFSTDTTVASRRVYLLSFLPQADVDRIVTYAAGQGKRSFAALVPESGYGLVVEAAFREAVGRTGARVVTVERYRPDRSDLAAKARAIAAAAGGIDALLVPEGGESAPAVAAALREAGVTAGRVQLLGTGQWDDAQLANNADLAGAWYPAPDKAGFAAFASRYSGRFGSAPPRTASLAYDATTLAAGLVRAAGPSAFSEQVITNPNGFIGVNGLFRFTSNGLSQRGLAVYAVGGRQLSGAPRTFQAGS